MGQPVSVSAYDGNDVTCYECTEKLVLRKSHKRMRNGIEFDVKSHFMHLGGNNGVISSSCTNESVIHKASKYVFGVSYYDVCIKCKKEACIVISGTPHVERTLAELPGNMRPDVTYLDDEGKVVGIVEIYHTHATVESNIDKYTDAGIAWCEVNAQEHLDALNLKIPRVRVRRSAFQQPCDDCCNAAVEQSKSEVAAADEQVRDALALVTAQKRCELLCLKSTKKLVALNEELSNIEKGYFNEFLEWFSEKYPDSNGPSGELSEMLDDPKGVLQFGKHRGRHLNCILESDPGYISWLKDKGDAWLPSYQKKVLREITEGLCASCMEPHGHSEKWKTICRSCYREMHR